MDSSNNQTIQMYRAMLEAFEKLETLFSDMNNLDLNLIYNQQLMCLASIENMIWDENDYFESLYNLHEDITAQIKHTQQMQNSIVFNDLTIIKLDKAKKPELSDKLKDVIDQTLIPPNATGLCDISGLKREKKILREAIIYPVLYPQLFTGNRKKWNTGLLYGPPGTGKTQLAHCIAAEINANFYNVSAADLLSSFVGESEKLIKTLFQNCLKTQKHSIIFIDEIDALCRRRSSSEKEYERRIKNELLNQLSSIEKHENKVFLLACTNCPWDLDAAFIRRFQKRIYIGLPDRETRFEMFQNHLKNPDDLDSILNLTEGWSGSDIHDLIKCAEYQPLKDLETTTHWIITADNKYLPTQNKFNIQKNLNEIPAEAVTVRHVETADYFMAFKEVTKTVTNEHIQKFLQFNESYGTIKQ